MADEVKIVIFEREYPFPTDYKPLDAVLIYELTGMEYVEYLEALEDDNKNLRATPGLLGIVLSRANPAWSRAFLMTQIQRISPEDWRVIGGERDIDAAGDAVVPPDAAGAEGQTGGLPPSSNEGQDGASVISTLPLPGSLPSGTGAG